MPMSTLEERLREVMGAKGWERRDLVRITGQSSSVVSQWLGHGSKTIHSIQKIEAALALERASGFSAAWIAKGIGAKRVAGGPELRPPAWELHEARSPYGPEVGASVDPLVTALAAALDQLPSDAQPAVLQALQALVLAPDSARARAALSRALSPEQKPQT
jgi:transcriptional regulator with XRE-family HTH domain